MTQLPPASELTPKRPRKHGRYVAVTMSEHLYLQLANAADLADRSVASMIRYCIVKALEIGGDDAK